MLLPIISSAFLLGSVIAIIVFRKKSGERALKALCALFGSSLALFVGLMIPLSVCRCSFGRQFAVDSQRYNEICIALDKDETLDTYYLLHDDIADLNAKIVESILYKDNIWIGCYINPFYSSLEPIGI